MRSYLLCISIVFTTMFVNAQPTITSTSLAGGDVYTFSGMQILGFTMPATGANKTWDYSASVDSGGFEIDSFKTPASTPYASLFPASTVALALGGGGYAYYKNSSTDFSNDGSILPGSDTTYYAKPLSSVHFPFTYGSIYSDSTNLYGHSTGQIDTIKEVVKHQGTGYGTLKTPDGKTYSNVLQVTTQTTEYFTFGTFTYTIISNSILFLQQGTNFYLMSVGINAQGNVTDVKYLYTGAITVTSYTFTGTGDWNTPANWSGGVVPPSTVPSGSTITINPQAGGSCSLNVPVTISAGASLTVKTGAVFHVNGNLTIVK